MIEGKERQRNDMRKLKDRKRRKRKIEDRDRENKKIGHAERQKDKDRLEKYTNIGRSTIKDGRGIAII